MPSSSGSVTRRTFAAPLLLAALPVFGPQACASPRNAFDWAGFKSRFVTADGRVMDTGNGGISHSEGQGLGLLFAHAGGDKDAFDRIWTWTWSSLGRSDSGLFSWRFQPGQGVTDVNNATDGDLMIAWALQRAADGWKRPEYAKAAAGLRAAILQRLVIQHAGRSLLLPGLFGFRHEDGAITMNPSYLVMPALTAFAKAEPASPWTKIRADALAFLRDAQFGPYHLPLDWVRVDPKGAVWIEPDRPARFGYDAVRVPLYLHWAGEKKEPAVRAAANWWTVSRHQDGTVPAWVDVATGVVANFNASPGLNAVVNLVRDDKLPRRKPPADNDYYSSALSNLVALSAFRA